MMNLGRRDRTIEFFLLPGFKVLRQNSLWWPSFEDHPAVGGPCRRLDTVVTTDGTCLHERSDTSGLNIDSVQALAFHVVSLPGVCKDETPIGGPLRVKPMATMPH